MSVDNSITEENRIRAEKDCLLHKAITLIAMHVHCRTLPLYKTLNTCIGKYNERLFQTNGHAMLTITKGLHK